CGSLACRDTLRRIRIHRQHWCIIGARDDDGSRLCNGTAALVSDEIGCHYLVFLAFGQVFKARSGIDDQGVAYQKQSRGPLLTLWYKVFLVHFELQAVFDVSEIVSKIDVTDAFNQTEAE